jgi:hypothetical protein
MTNTETGITPQAAATPATPGIPDIERVADALALARCADADSAELNDVLAETDIPAGVAAAVCRLKHAAEDAALELEMWHDDLEAGA